MSVLQKTFAADVGHQSNHKVLLRGWISRLRVLAKTTFIILKDCSGEVQCVASTDSLSHLKMKLDDAVEIRGVVRSDERAKRGVEVDVESVAILNPTSNVLPFNSSSDIQDVSSDIRLEYRPLTLRNDRAGKAFRVQASILKHFRDYLASQRFTEIVSSKIVGGGTEGGTNLFEIKYFDRVAY